MDPSIAQEESKLLNTPTTDPSPIAQEEPQLVDQPVIVPSPIAQEPDNDVPAPGSQFAEFAAGCFWGLELAFQRIPGVTKTEVGYTHGISHNPSYEVVRTNKTNHAEVVRVQYDPNECSYETLLDLFWSRHDPTTLNRQVSFFFYECKIYSDKKKLLQNFFIHSNKKIYRRLKVVRSIFTVGF